MEIYKVHAKAWRHMSKIISEQSLDDVEPEVAEVIRGISTTFFEQQAKSCDAMAGGGDAQEVEVEI